MAKIYIIDLSQAEQDYLVELTNKGQTAARKIKRANILLLAESGKTDVDIAQLLHTSIPTVERTRRKFVVGGLDWALTEQPRSGRSAKVDDKVEAILTTIAQSVPPAGRQRWTLQMLANRLVELKVIGRISDETVRRVLKKTI
jgi:transposase